MSYGSVDAPNYRETFTSPPQLNLTHPTLNYDAPNYRPHAPVYERPYERRFARQSIPTQSIASQLIQQTSILNNKQLIVPLLWNGVNFVQPFSVTWKTATIITKATINIRAYTDSDSMGMEFSLNDTVLDAVYWDAFQSQQWREKSLDVTNKIAKGTNNFKTDYFFTWAGGRGAYGWVYADLLLEYTGDDPAVKNQFDPTMLLWGGALLGVGYIGYKAIQKKGYI